MDLKNFKESFAISFIPSPEQTIIIDKPVDLEGYQIHLLALTYKKGSYSLWVIDCMVRDFETINRIEDKSIETNRDSLNANIINDVRFIESIELDGYVFSFNGAITDALIQQENRAHRWLKYFINHGIELSKWDDVSLSKIELTEFTQSKASPRLGDTISNREIKIKFNPYFEKKDVFKRYILDYNLLEPVELKFHNPFVNKEESFYVYNFETYSFEKYISSIKSDERYEHLPKEQKDSMIEIMTSYFEDLRSQNLQQILMTYESDSNLQLYSTEYLDRIIHRYSDNNGCCAYSAFFRLQNDKGIHGKKLRTDSFLVDSKEILSSIEIEIHSVTMERPEEVIIV